MQMTDTVSAARSLIEELELADPDEEHDLYDALVDDEAFAAACLRYENAVVYATHEHATEADREARRAPKRSVREHAQRVRGQVDVEEGEADG